MTSSSKEQPTILVVGNYCHDFLIRDSVLLAESLGGAASFISAVLDGLSLPFTLVSKAGPEFTFAVSHPPFISQDSQTTLFHAYFSTSEEETQQQYKSHDSDRVLKRVRSCDPIAPSDLPNRRFTFGLAVGVAGEITPQTLSKMVEICDTVLVDVQSLIRVFDPVDGTVSLVKLSESGFGELIEKIGFLKASSDEAAYVDIEELRRRKNRNNCCCTVVVTNGREGCTVHFGDDEEQKIEPFEAFQVDPTGAGDSFMGGLVVGLAHRLPVPDAALLGNFFGSLTVGQVGLPRFDPKLLQALKDELYRRSLRHCSNSGNDGKFVFVKPHDHDEFFEALVKVKSESSFLNGDSNQELKSSHKVLQQLENGPCSGERRALLSSEEPINKSASNGTE